MEKTLIIMRELINEGLLASNFGNSYILWNKLDMVGIAGGVILGLITFAVRFLIIDFDYSDKTEKIVNSLFIAFMSLSILMMLVGVFAIFKRIVMDAEIERAMVLSNVDFGALIKSLGI